MEILIIGSDKGLKKKIKRQFSRAASYYFIMRSKNGVMHQVFKIKKKRPSVDLFLFYVRAL